MSEQQLTGAEDILWDLSILYNSVDDPKIEADLKAGEALVQAFVEKYKGKIASLSAQELHQAYRDYESIYEKMYLISNYAGLNFSTYTQDPKWGALYQRTQENISGFQQQLVFFDLEWNAVDDNHAKKILTDPAIGEYRYHLEVARLRKPYQLSEAEERILIEKSNTGESAWTRFFDQMMGGTELDVDGKKIPMPRVLSMMTNPERDTRIKAADAITAGLKNRNMELTFVFNTLLADKASDDKMRGYPSWITSRNLSNKAPDSVVDALISTVTGSYDLVARHYNLKRKLMGFEELFDYDRYAPLPLTGSDTFYTWEQARETVLNAFQSFSPKMAMVASKFFDENWIHAPVMNGKRGGAYASYGTRHTHPWVFMNFAGRPDDVKTLAHELGHGIHMYLAGQSQSMFSMFTPLTTAEMASTFAEIVVFYDLMAKEPNKQAQLSMLSQKIDQNIATIYRQVSMNRFENAMHTARRAEGELTSDRFSELWMETQRAMFKGSVTLREDYGLWWSYIPHFLHTPGYVYAYAFGELLVMALYSLYKQQGESFVPKYEQLLADGDSDYPDKLLAKVGVDLNDPNFWAQGVKVLAEYVAQEEALAKELFPEKF
jgi:oligoendopeptidase F